MPQAAPSVGALAGQTRVSTQFHSRAAVLPPPLPPLLVPPLPPLPLPGPPLNCARHVQRSLG